MITKLTLRGSDVCSDCRKGFVAAHLEKSEQELKIIARCLECGAERIIIRKIDE